MNKVILYSNGCPNCRTLKEKLENAGIEYEIFDNVEKMIEKGMNSMPMLEVNGMLLTFINAIKWIREEN